MPDDEGSSQPPRSARERAHTQEFLQTLLEQIRRMPGNERFIQIVEQALADHLKEEDTPDGPGDAPKPDGSDAAQHPEE